ncbi:MAG: tRNA lysidine(34) synthetase TilS [Chloroflexi bacterium]|nr:tRNA lysidine(34) synthetase TilS [Chloroflexota bacterium]
MREHGLLLPGPLVAAVSGGTDSCALLVLLHELSEETGALVHVAHFDHRTRPRTAAADAQFVADLAARYGVPLRVGRAEHRASSEDDARRERYAFLRRAAAEIGALAIATGHTRDDQAETVLLHLTRGSGIGGLGGLRPSRDGIVRPLLSLTRRDTAAVCAAAGIVPREDPTNGQLRFARNRIRHRVLPELARVNPQVVEAVARLADAAALSSGRLRERAERALLDALDGDALMLERFDPDPEVRGEALSLAWQRLTGRVLSASHRAELLKQTDRRDGSAAIDLPGGRALREYAVLTLMPATAVATTAEAQTLGPDVPVSWRGWTIAWADAATEWPLSLRLPAGFDRVLTVRARVPGDRMAGVMRTKVQDVFTDAKVPVRLRATHPLVVGDDGVVWVPGVAVADGSARPHGGADGPMLVARPPDDGPENIFWSPRVTRLASKAETRSEDPS